MKTTKPTNPNRDEDIPVACSLCETTIHETVCDECGAVVCYACMRDDVCLGCADNADGEDGECSGRG